MRETEGAEVVESLAPIGMDALATAAKAAEAPATVMMCIVWGGERG